MKLSPSLLSRAYRSLGFIFTLALATPAFADLPVAIDGEPLPSLAPMLADVTPAVVNVNSKTRVRVRNQLLEDPFFRHFFGMPNAPQERIQQSLGSGVIVDAAKGYVLTNNHVVEGADELSVTLADGRTLQASVVGSDPDTDVAVIRIPTDGLVALPLADSANLRVGDFVVAVGNPFGIGQSVTSGIVSALGRTALRGLGYQNFIQTDASINPGNSGGALVNLRGELVGINTAIFTPSGGNVGIGFAIPANLAADVMRQLIAYGEVKRGSLGVQAQDVDEQLARMLDLKETRGAVITEVQADSPAQLAGLKPGDVVVGLNGKRVQNERELHNAEGLLPLDAEVELDLIRDGAPHKTRATLKAETLRTLPGESLDVRLGGAQFSDLTERERRKGVNGVAVTRVSPNSRAAANGLASGDVVFAINQRELRTVAEMEALLARQPRQLLLSVARGRAAFFLLLE